jgi:predicted DNA-binding protein with PD1-like motif
VIAGESQLTRCVMGRLEAGEDVVEALRELARQERIDAGFVRAHGAVEAAELARYDASARAYVPAGAVAGAAELASAQGSISLEAGGGGAGVRLWAVLAAAPEGGAPGRVEAGLLLRARAVAVEFAVDVLDDGDLERRPDPGTGLALWRTPRRR